MKRGLEARLLQHLLAKKKANEGLTLIELLVVVIIIGILAAIALPSMLSQAAKARLAAAKTAVGSVNRAQQVYRLENQEFAHGDEVWEKLGIGEPKVQGYAPLEVTSGYHPDGHPNPPQYYMLVNATALDPQGTGVTGCVRVHYGGVVQSGLGVEGNIAEGQSRYAPGHCNEAFQALGN